MSNNERTHIHFYTIYRRLTKKIPGQAVHALDPEDEGLGGGGGHRRGAGRIRDLAAADRKGDGQEAMTVMVEMVMARMMETMTTIGGPVCLKGQTSSVW